jgi:hypothetical protein
MDASAGVVKEKYLFEKRSTPLKLLAVENLIRSISGIIIPQVLKPAG